MSDTSHSGASEAVIDPVPVKRINAFGATFLCLAILLFYLLVTTWPVLDVDVCKPVLDVCKKAFRPINLFGLSFSWAPDRQMIFMVMMAGAIGSLTHTIKSFGDYVGNRQLSENWMWFLVLRIPIGVALAVLFYFIVRGGLLLPTLPGQGSVDIHAQTTQLNPYGVAAFGALAGMFSKQATDKLAAVFDTLFAMKEPVKRSDKLDGNKAPPEITATEPKELTVGSAAPITIIGRGFQPGCGVTVNGGARKPSSFAPDRLVIPIFAGDVASTGDLKIVVKNADDSSSPEFIVKVVQ